MVLVFGIVWVRFDGRRRDEHPDSREDVDSWNENAQKSNEQNRIKSLLDDCGHLARVDPKWAQASQTTQR